MAIAHVEMIGGASGNMLLGALLDAGAARDALETALRTVVSEGWHSQSARVEKRGIAAAWFDFAIDAAADRHARHLGDVLAILAQSSIADRAKARAAAIYERLARAEAGVHGTTVERVHFHEVGATDAILDVAGVCVALELLDVDALYCSAFPLGSGTVSMHHGIYPNPPPATAELLRGSPTYDAGIANETVTPTGAAILTTLVAETGVRPPMRAERIGYGAGTNDFAIPNVLRVSVGEPALEGGSDVVAVIECAIDDMSPQHFELAVERVLAAGAYDVWLVPVTMKKLRPGVLFGAVAPLASERAVADAVLAHTSTLGVRVRSERRRTLERTIDAVATPLGTVRVKTATVDGRARRTLEYDDVARIARTTGRPIAEVAAHLEEHLPRT